jgi:hypothetical protein
VILEEVLKGFATVEANSYKIKSNLAQISVNNGIYNIDIIKKRETSVHN